MGTNELQSRWEAILRQEGLAMSRGRRVIKASRTLLDEDAACCSKCIGFHTEEGDCLYREQGGEG